MDLRLWAAKDTQTLRISSAVKLSESSKACKDRKRRCKRGRGSFYLSLYNLIVQHNFEAKWKADQSSKVQHSVFMFGSSYIRVPCVCIRASDEVDVGV